MNRIWTGVLAATVLTLGGAANAQTSWYPSKFGANDEIGAANYMTPATALQAARLTS